MSELMNAQIGLSGFRWNLLTTASAAALIVSVYTTSQAEAADNDAPLWIELGGQFVQEQNDREAFLPPFLLTTPRPTFDAASPADIERAPSSSWEGDAKISFNPAGTDWVFSAAIVYGRSDRNKSRNEQTAQPSSNLGGFYDAYQSIAAKSSETHAVVDFRAGKDVGLGMFGNGGNSVISVGLRYAQFTEKTGAGIKSQPTNVVAQGSIHYHRFFATLAARHKFTGIGPSLSWDASAGLIGSPSAGGITFDWGLNGAVLFGRQRVQGHHQTTNLQYGGIILGVSNFGGNYVSYVATPVYRHHASPTRSRQITVPNIGGFAGVSWRYPNAKVSIGYRADFFFGAMDGGIDAAHRENVGFYGPFATISIGVGG